MKQPDYKLKYQELKATYMSSVDTAYRLGFQDGQKQAQQDQVQQQAADAQAQAQQQGMNSPNMQAANAESQTPESGQDTPDQNPKSGENPMGSELDNHIAELEGMIAKSELNPVELNKAIANIKKLQSNKPPTLNIRAQKNLPQHSKEALTQQHKLVGDIMAKWEQQEKQTSETIVEKLKRLGVAE